MHVQNVHHRELGASLGAVGAFIDGLTSPEPRLWLDATWPPTRQDAPLRRSSSSGYGPLCYVVEGLSPCGGSAFGLSHPEALSAHELKARSGIALHSLERRDWAVRWALRVGRRLW